MLIRRRSHSVPGLNTTSTADISFMLLIFFLVTTSMDVDKGLLRQLPPADSKKQTELQTEINKSDVMALKLTADNQLLIDGHSQKLSNLRGLVKNFIIHVGNKHVITVDVDPSSSYDLYFHVQNELMATYNELRNQLARKQYGHDFAMCSQQQKDVIREKCPQRISENTNSAAEGGQQ